MGTNTNDFDLVEYVDLTESVKVSSLVRHAIDDVNEIIDNLNDKLVERCTDLSLMDQLDLTPSKIYEMYNPDIESCCTAIRDRCSFIRENIRTDQLNSVLEALETKVKSIRDNL